MLAEDTGSRGGGAGDGEVIVGIDGTPAVREYLTGTEVYARSIINALAASKGTRGMEAAACPY